MRLDERLTAVANMVRQCDVFADIGTDHAYLPIYLVENGIAKRAIASDLRKGPLNNGRETVNEHGLQDKIELRLSNGLDNFEPYEVTEIAVAGMGGLLISEFIERANWIKNPDTHLILQPMTHSEELRKTLYDNGFYIDRECAASVGGKLYVVISAFHGGKKREYDEIDLIVGKLPQNNDELSKEYLCHLYDRYNKKLGALEDAHKECELLRNIVTELRKWQR